METDLIFLGLLILQNALKAQSAAVIRQLHEADIRTVMVTGKNVVGLFKTASCLQFLPLISAKAGKIHPQARDSVVTGREGSD